MQSQAPLDIEHLQSSGEGHHELDAQIDSHNSNKDISSFGQIKDSYGPPIQNQIEVTKTKFNKYPRQHLDTYGPPKPVQIESTGGAIISGGSSGISIPLKYTYSAPKPNNQHGPNIIYGAPSAGAPPSTPLRLTNTFQKHNSFKLNSQQLPPLYKYGTPFSSGSSSQVCNVKKYERV